MKRTSCRLAAVLALAACAPVAVKPQASSMPASQPASLPASAPALVCLTPTAGKTFTPIDPKDPTKGYYSTFDGVKGLIERSKAKDQQLAVQQIECDERVQLVQDNTPVSAWNLWGKPTVVGVGMFLLGLGAGIAGAKISK